MNRDRTSNSRLSWRRGAALLGVLRRHVGHFTASLRSEIVGLADPSRSLGQRLRTSRRVVDLGLALGAVLVLWGPGLSMTGGPRPTLRLRSTPASVAEEPRGLCSPDHCSSVQGAPERFASLEEVYRDEYQSLVVTVTGYSSSASQTDSSPFVTAVSTEARSGVIALSQDLLREFSPGAPFAFHDRVEIPGLGQFLVEDTMHRRWRRRADIWFPSRGEAMRWGRRAQTIYRVSGREAALAYMQPAAHEVAATFGDTRFQ